MTSTAKQLVTISPRFQVVIPKAVREALSLRPGQKVHAIAYDGRIELIPEEPIRSLRGFLRGSELPIEREPDRL